MDWRTHDDYAHRVTFDAPPLLIDAEVVFTIDKRHGTAVIDPITVGSLTLTRDMLVQMFGAQVADEEAAASRDWAFDFGEAA